MSAIVLRCRYLYTHARTHTRTHAQECTRTQAHTHTHTHARSHVHTHTHACTHTHTPHTLSRTRYDGRSLAEPVVTIASPVIHNGNLVGVVGTDIAVSQLFFFKQLVSRYEKSYLFVMRRGCNVALYHPLLPLPPPDGSSLVHGIELLEREADKQGIIAQMEQYVALLWHNSV